jgi:hypothetical protein
VFASPSAAIPGVVLCVADGIVRIAAGIIGAAVCLSSGIDRLIGVTAGEKKRCDHDRDAVGRSFGRCGGEVGHHALHRRVATSLNSAGSNLIRCAAKPLPALPHMGKADRDIPARR